MRTIGKWTPIIGLAMMLLFVGCATGPPTELWQQNDHAGLAQWYEQEAISLQAYSDGMAKRARTVSKPSGAMAKYCEDRADTLAAKAEKAMELARAHKAKLG